MVNSRGVQLDLAQQAGLSTERFPQSEEEADIAEDTLARELGRLSLEEHEKGLFEVHGIAHVAEEDPATIERALKGLQEELEKIEDKDAYEAARFLNEQYVTNREFLLRFLRCEEFNTKASAETIVNHFNVKRELFGSGEILAREVRQSDLSAKELAFVKSGFIQLLPSLDISGRVVYVIICDLPYSDGSGVSCEEDKEDKEDTGLIMRSCWYTRMSILDESSSAGAVWISYHYRAIPVEFQDFMRFFQVQVAIPLKCSGGHHCYTDSSLRASAAGFQLFFSEKERRRSKVHHGTAEEIHFKLQTFGLPMDVFPVKKDGTFDVSWHLEWLETLRKQEENNSARFKSITIPQNYDVLFGKNARARDHNGNMRAHNLVEMFFEDYERAHKFQKTEIANKIISSIRDSGGRFLKQDGSGGWAEVTDANARQKIAHWCRHKRHKTTKDCGASPDNIHLTKAAASKRVTPCPSPELDDSVLDGGRRDKGTLTQPEKVVRIC